MYGSQISFMAMALITRVGQPCLLERILDGQAVHDGRQHAHVVPRRAVHPARAGGQPAEDVAAADDDRRSRCRRACRRPTWPAMPRTTSGSMPYSCSPMSASPESLSSTRRGARVAAVAAGSATVRRPLRSLARRRLADRHPREARDPDVLAQQGDLLGDRGRRSCGRCRGTAARAGRPTRTTCSACPRRSSGSDRPGGRRVPHRPRRGASARRASSAGTSSRLTYCGAMPATCIASSRASCWKSSVRATKSVSQFSSRSTPSREPWWM